MACWPKRQRYPPLQGGLVYLRARHYAPRLDIFPSLDPFEGIVDRPVSLNGYSWVEGRPINFVDPTGNQLCEIGSPVAPDITRPDACPPVSRPPAPYRPGPYRPSPWLQRIRDLGRVISAVERLREALELIEELTCPAEQQATPTPTPTPQPREIVVDLGPGDNLAEIDTLLNARPDKKIVAIDVYAEALLFKMLEQGRITIDKIPIPVPNGIIYSTERLEIIKGDYSSSPNLLDGRQAVEMFSVFPGPVQHTYPDFRIAVSNYLFMGKPMYIVVDLEDFFERVRGQLSGRINYNEPSGYNREIRSAQSGMDSRGPMIHFPSTYSRGIVYEIWGLRMS